MEDQEFPLGSPVWWSMTVRHTLGPLREAARRLNEAEIERNRLIRALRSKRETLTDLAEAADVSSGRRTR